MDNWQIHIVDRAAQMITDIFITKRHSPGKIEIYRAEGSTHVFPIGRSNLPASLSIDSTMLPDLLEALLRKGIKPKEQSFIAGKLEATEKHLADMRALVLIDVKDKRPKQ